MDTTIAKVMLAFQRDIECTAIEPDSAELERFKSRLDGDKLLNGRVSFDWNHCCSEEYEVRFEKSSGSRSGCFVQPTTGLQQQQLQYFVTSIIAFRQNGWENIIIGNE